MGFNLSDAAVTIMNFVGEDLIDGSNSTNGTGTFKAYTTTQATVFVVCASRCPSPLRLY